MENRIKEILKRENISQKELCEKLNITKVGMSNLVNAPILKIDTFEKMAKAIGVPVWELCLSDEELAEIRATANKLSAGTFHCPACGATLKFVPFS